MRAFIAINLPDAEKQRLWDALSPLRARELPVRWTSPESIHLTVKFLRQLDEQRVDEVQQRLQEVTGRHPPFVLSIGGIGAFPDLRHARIWWIGVRPARVLHALHAALEDALVHAGFARDERPFAPHLTVGRAKSERRGPQPHSHDTAATTVDYAATIEVHALDLMQSHLGGGPPRYERIARAPLGSAGSTLQPR